MEPVRLRALLEELRRILAEAKASPEHDVVVRTYAALFRSAFPENVEVCVDLEGGTKPPLLKGFQPDVYVNLGGFEIAVEVETTESMETQHTQDQLAAFKAWAAEAPLGRVFLLDMVTKQPA